MKNLKPLILIFITIILYIIVISSIIKFIKNPNIGKDTITHFGDYNYQIQKSTYDNKKAYVLHDLKEKKDIIYVAKYKNYKKDNTVYIIGKRNIEDSNYIYGVLNYKTKQYNSYDTFDSLPDSIKPIFQQQEDFNFYVNTPY